MPPTYLDDGNIAFDGGQNDGLLPDRIGENQYRRGINVQTKNGTLSPRPGFIHQELTMLTAGKWKNRTFKQIFDSGKFQAAMSYDSDDGTFIIAVISGLIFRIDPARKEVEYVPIGETEDADRMNQYRKRLNWSYAGRFLVFFDYPNLPVILENREARRADLDEYEAPVSNLGTYVQNRFWIANVVHEFTASDPIGGINANAPVTFEEVLAPAAAYLGQVFSLGSQSTNQPITAMGFLQVADTSTGVGPLFVATKNSIYAYQATLPRSEWEATSFGRLILYNAGIAGSRAFTNQNSDVMFLSGDNQFRSLLMGRSQQERWENAPLSREITPWLEEFADQKLTSTGIVASYKNRVFVTVGPYRSSAIGLEGQSLFDYAHGGLAVLELDNVSALGATATPAWAGLWTGISPAEMIVLEEGVFIFSKDDGGLNRLYFMDETKSYDMFEGEQVDIVSRVYTREYDFGKPFQDKELGHISYSMSEIEGSFKMVAEYKPGSSEKWSLWRCFEHCAQTEICDADEECGANECEIPILNSHAFREIDFGDPVEKDCDLLTNEQSDVMRRMGLRLTFKGKNWKLRNIHLRSQVVPETNRPSTQKCETIEQRRLCAECEANDWELFRTATKDAKWPERTLTL